MSDFATATGRPQWSRINAAPYRTRYPWGPPIRCDNQASHSSHFIGGDQMRLGAADSYAYVTHIRSCVDSSSGQGPNHIVEFNITSSSPDLNTAQSMRIFAPSGNICKVPQESSQPERVTHITMDNTIHCQGSALIALNRILPAEIKVDPSRVELSVSGIQYAFLDRCEPDLNSNLLKDLDDQSKTIIKNLLDGVKAYPGHAGSLAIASFQHHPEDPEDETGVWNLELNSVHSSRAPEHPVTYRIDDTSAGFDGTCDISADTAAEYLKQFEPEPHPSAI